MDQLEPVVIQCPYCWERIEVLIDTSIAQQEYVEDCQVCCRPVTLNVTLEAGSGPTVEARGEDDP